MTVILASGSPRRKEILTSIGVEFEVVPSDVDERALPGEEVTAMVERLAVEKARSVSRKHPERLVIAGDTVVELEGTVLGKPEDEREAVEMLSAIAGRTHVVYSAIALARIDPEHLECRLDTTRVRMMSMTRDEIEWYVGTGEPLDKAGSYAIQGIGAMFVHSIEGNYTNVVGLTVPTLVEMLDRAGESVIRRASMTGEAGYGGASR